MFTGSNCQGCHGGENWTISEMFYNPNDPPSMGSGTVNNALKTFDANLNMTGFRWRCTQCRWMQQSMRYGGSNAAALDQIQCILRPVGTFGVSEPEVRDC